MKFIFTADLHIHEYKSDSAITDEGITLKLQELLNTFQQVCDYANNNGIDTIIIGGDIIHHKNIIHARAFSKFKKLILKNDNLTFIMFPGNHDRSELSGHDTAVHIFIGLPNVKVYDSETILDNITILPDSNELATNLKNIKSNTILCSHFPINGGRGDSGIELSTNYSKEYLNKFKLVLLGDLHTYQKIKLKNGYAYYPGSLIPHTKADVGDKGFLVVDSETLDVDFIKTTGYRKYYTFEITDQSDCKEIANQIQELQENNNFITVKNKMKDTPEELSVLSESVSILDLYEPDTIQRGISSSMNIEEQMEKYLKISNINEKDQPQYLAVGIKLLKKIIDNE